MLFFKSNYVKNLEVLEKYHQSCLITFPDTKNTTCETYNSTLKLFVKWLKDNGDYYLFGYKMLNNMSDIMEKYTLYCREERGNNNVTIWKKISNLSGLYVWGIKKKYIKQHPMDYVVDRPKTKGYGRRNSYFLDSAQINYIFKELDSNKKYDLRTKIIFSLLLDTGMRISALYSLRLSQLDLNECVFTKVKEKGNKIVDYYFYERTQKYLKEYLELRNKNNINTDDLLITSYNKHINKMSRETIRARVRTIGKLVNIPDFYPHSIRKTSINLINQVGGLELASEFANHVNSRVTKEHYTKPKDTKEKANKVRDIRNKLNIK